MKKFLIFLTVFILFSLTACVNTNSSSIPEKESESVLQSESDEEKESVQEKTFAVNLPSSCIGGRVIADKTRVKWNETVTFTVTAEDEYEIDYFKINGQEKSLNTLGQYMLSNPYEDITVNVKFSKVNEDGIVYVSSTAAPIIDGKIDQVWATAPAFYAGNIHNHNTDEPFTEEFAYLKVLWNETGMYFLGCVYDSTIVNSDRFNIWFSEVYTDVEKDYSSNEKYGNYAICINPEGENLLYTNLDVSSFWEAQVVQEEGYYIVEIFMPRIGDKELVEGAYVGLDLSVDYFTRNGSIDNDRDYYAYWYGAGKYWSNVGALKPMKLLKK